MPSTLIPERLRTFSVLVQPSLTRRNWKEQFGRALMEAMACGVPVVGSDSAEIPNVVGDAGLIVPEGDPRALREALARLLGDAELREDLGRRAAPRVLECFTNARIAEQTVRVYRPALDAARPSLALPSSGWAMPRGACRVGSWSWCLLGACSRGAVPAVPTEVAPSVAATQTAVSTLEARFDPTAAVGGGANASARRFDGRDQRTFCRGSPRPRSSGSPPTPRHRRTRARRCTSMSITAQDAAGCSKSLSASDKKSARRGAADRRRHGLAESRVYAADLRLRAQIIATRPPGGPNTVIADASLP